MGICIIRAELYLFARCIHIPALYSEAQAGQTGIGESGEMMKMTNRYTNVQVEPNRLHRSIWFASPWFRERLFSHFFFRQRSPALQIYQIDNSITRLVSTHLLSASQR